jgi:hypothetical protein
VFPIEERYAVFIATIVIVLCFSAVMPILYIIGFLSIWFTVICDKLLLFRVYQKPVNYTKDLQKNVFKFLYVSIMMHCVISPIILSERHLILAGGVSETDSYSRIGLVFSTPYLLPYVVIFLLLACWAVFDSTIVKFCAYCMKKFDKNLGTVYRSKFHQNFFGTLNDYQINKLKLSMEMQLNTCVHIGSMIARGDHANLNIIQQICRNTIMELQNQEKQKKMTIQI